jgi:hypothetical protein
MEKNTKILIGVGAVIAAYLILKPKKAAAQPKAVASTSVSQIAEELTKDLSLGLVRCGDGTMQKKEDCATRGGYNTGPLAVREWAPVPKGPCVCITAPCNC